jgi:steroid 5-alpha reductase family enzyme
VFLGAAPQAGPRAFLLGTLVLAWALRLGSYLTWRNWGHGEDRRYAAMRERHGATFWWRSLFIVFLLQAGIAGLLSTPALAVSLGPDSFGWPDLAGGALALFGIAFEATADWQLNAFRARQPMPGQLMSDGLWAWTRHPNYFGEACVWWGVGIIGLAAGAWWALAPPLLMNWLLLRVSGVTLLEADLKVRKPEYAAYVRRTSAFLPRPPLRNANS